MGEPWKRKEVIGDCTLYLGDCLEVMPLLGKVDAVVTDPPYGVLDEDWDNMDEQELAAFTMCWAGWVRRLSDTATIFFGQKTRRTIQDILYLIYPEIRQVIWSKGGGVAASGGMFYSYESAYICGPVKDREDIVGPKTMLLAASITKCRTDAGMSKGQIDIAVRGKKTGLCYRWEEACCIPTDDQITILSKILNLGSEFYSALADAKKDRELNLTANARRTKEDAAHLLDVLKYPSPKGIGHPTSKPVGLMQDLCGLVKGQTILDPFMGSGTTLVACAKLGRAGVGIELDEEYFNIACERVREAYRQPDLFVQADKPEPTQEGFDLGT